MNTFIAITLAISGAVAVLAGTAILTAAAIQALRPMRTTTEAVVDADGMAKVLEMLAKLPQWLLAVLAGDLQLWLAMRALAGQSWWPS